MVSVCHVISSFRPDIGGAERATENLCKGLAVHLRVSILTRYYVGRPRREEVSSFALYRLGWGGRGWFGALTFIFHSILWLIFRGRDFGIVHVQNIDAPLLVGMFARFFLRRRLVVTLQGEQTMIQRKRTFWGRFRVRLMVRAGDRFVAVTGETERQYLLEGISSERIVRIPNGIDTDYYSPSSSERAFLRSRLGYGDNENIILYLGRLVSLKRVESLLRAFVSFRSMGVLLIVGDGPERVRLEDFVEREGLRGVVRFLGSTHDVLSYYRLADIFVLPSLYEGLSVSLLEAMSCGLCVIVSGCPGNLDIVSHGVNGLVFPVDEPELLVSRLGEALRSREMRIRLGRAAREAVEGSRSIARVVSSHLNLYENLLLK